MHGSSSCPVLACAVARASPSRSPRTPAGVRHLHRAELRAGPHGPGVERNATSLSTAPPWRGVLARAVAGLQPVARRRRSVPRRTLERWPNPNTRRKNRSILVSFYDWAMQELEPPRDSNPARQTRPPKVRKPQVYRMTRDEVVAFLHAATTRREQRVAFLGVCAGIRNHELRHLQCRHFERPGWVHVSAEIAKGGRERWMPILLELERSSPRSWRASTRRATTRPRAPGPAST
jgi:hypothetical protein